MPSYAALLVAASAAVGASATSCKAYPGTPSWPVNIAWQALNFTVGGRLDGVVPPAASCHNTFNGVETYNKASCDNVNQNWGTQPFHYWSPVSIMNDLYTGRTCLPTKNATDACTIGDYPAYVVKSQGVTDVIASVLFARLFNLRLIVKNTGHDFMGRSTAAGSLSIWTHQFKEMTPLTWRSQAYTGSAIRLGSGVQHTELYPYLDSIGKVVVGGECISVGISGGYMQGGGHGPLATLFGLGSDQALEYTIVTADGIYRTASETENSDLFWALRGGGPGPWGVVLSVTVKTFPTPKTAGAVVTFGTMDTEKYWKGVDAFHAISPNFTAKNMYAYYEMVAGGTFDLRPLLAPGMNKAQLTAITAPLFAQWKAAGVNYTATLTEYPTFQKAYTALFLGEPAGAAQFVSSRIFSKDNILKNNAAITGAFRKMIEGGLYVIGHMVSPGVNGGANNAVNPIWKNAVLLPLTNQFLQPGQSIDAAIANQVQYDNAMKAASPGSGAYLNEGNIYDPDFAQAFWGTNYPRLVQIQKKYDPAGLWWYKAAVNSERYTEVNGRVCQA